MTSLEKVESNECVNKLDEFFKNIYPIYEEINKKWENDNLYKRVNLKNILVKNINIEDENFKLLLDYRSFLNRFNSVLIYDLQNNFNIQDICKVESRIKQKNSIEFKIENYIKNRQDGETPLIKCANDLFGMRIIFESKFTHEQIEKFINESYPKFRYVFAKREEYIASHIYIKMDNYTFPWKLQIWEQEREKINKLSHEKYKQEYTKWENENKKNKGGASIW